jgi:phospholipid/cholesterol/gamma-HCH transport system substrate-binding protein
MKRRSVPSFRIGLFVILGFLVLLIFIFAIGSQEQLFNRTSIIHANFKTVSGLKSGAQIQMSGIAVGSVTDIRLPQSVNDSVRVTMKILTKAMPLVRTNSKAVISSEGLIGDKIIVIEQGTGPSGAIAEGEYIQGQAPRDFTEVFDTLNKAVDQVNQLTYEATMLVRGLREGQGTVGKLLTDDQLYRDVQALALESRRTMLTATETIQRVGNDADRITGEVQAFVSDVRNSKGTVGKLINDDELYNDIRSTIANVRVSSYDMRDALAKVSLGAGNFSEVTEALKHNFLIKGYFEERGYWDAPQFELTIDRKIDSLNRLHKQLQDKMIDVKAQK